jgi:hypothetical protein
VPARPRFRLRDVVRQHPFPELLAKAVRHRSWRSSAALSVPLSPELFLPPRFQRHATIAALGRENVSSGMANQARAVTRVDGRRKSHSVMRCGWKPLRLRGGEKANHPAGSLRANAQILLLKGDVPAIREIADRLDGRVPQAIVGDDESDPIRYAISDEPMDPDEWARKHQTAD